MKVEIGLLQLEALVHAANHIPKRTPNRWRDIAKYIQQIEPAGTSSQPQTVLGTIGKPVPFEITAKDCQSVYEKLICRDYQDLLTRDFSKPWFGNDGKNAVKPIVLLPFVTTCCGKTIRLRSPAFPIVFTETGTSVAALFHDQCNTCKTLYHYSYREKDDGARIYNNPDDTNARYFEYSNQTCFSKQYLKDVTNNITFSGTTFKSRAQVYESTHGRSATENLKHLTNLGRKVGDKWTLSEEIIESCWFLWILINTYQEHGVLEQTDIPCTYTSGNHRDIEQVCEQCWDFLQRQPNKWIRHSCSAKGCQEGYVTVDGNCKLRRPICAAGGPLLADTQHNVPKIKNVCRNSPILGNQHSKGNKYCYEHQHLNDVAAVPTTSPASSAPQNTESNSDEQDDHDVPNSEDELVEKLGCKKRSNIKKFYDTTAGVLALIKPCGIVVAMTEMYTSESLAQVFLFLLQTFCKPAQSVEDFQRLKYVGYDRACQLRPYLVKQAKENSAGAQLLVDNVEFLVDLFHCKKHTTPSCMPLDNPECIYHPHLPKFREIHGTNTNSCEQGFFRLNTYKYVTRKLTQYKRNIFFYTVNDQFNKHLQRKLNVVS